MAFPGQKTGYRAPKAGNPFQGLVDWAVNFAGPTSQYDPSKAAGVFGAPRYTPDQMRSLTAPGLGRPAAAAEPVAAPTGHFGPTQDVYEQPGVGFFDRRSGRFLGRGSTAGPAGGSPTMVVHGLGADGRVDRTQSDQYKQYALNPQGQFERYFQSPEMNQYFGQISGAPKDVAAMTALASQGAAPTTSPLSTYYRAQSAAGRGNMDEVVGGLTYGKTGQEAKNLEAWARANPMLAFREYNKRFPQGQPGIGPTPATLQTDGDYGTFGEMFKKEKRFFPGAEPPTMGAALTTQPSTAYTMPTPGGGFDTSQAYVNPAAKTFLQNMVLDVDAMKKLQQVAFNNPINTASQYAHPSF